MLGVCFCVWFPRAGYAVYPSVSAILYAGFREALDIGC